MKMNTFRSTRGMTLIEIMCAVAIVALLGLMIIPNSTTAKQKAEESTMKARAAALNYAASCYTDAVGPTNAISAWQGAANDEARYQLIRPYLSQPAATLSAYLLSGWSVTLATDPRTACQLLLNSVTVSYN